MKKLVKKVPSRLSPMDVALLVVFWGTILLFALDLFSGLAAPPCGGSYVDRVAECYPWGSPQAGWFYENKTRFAISHMSFIVIFSIASSVLLGFRRNRKKTVTVAFIVLGFGLLHNYLSMALYE